MLFLHLSIIAILIPPFLNNIIADLDIDQILFIPLYLYMYISLDFNSPRNDIDVVYEHLVKEGFHSTFSALNGREPGINISEWILLLFPSIILFRFLFLFLL